MKLTLLALSLSGAMLMTGYAWADPPPAAPTTVAQPASTEAPTAPPPKTDPPPDKPAKVCHYEEVSGSMIPRKVCH
jgi:hypothetical protein